MRYPAAETLEIIRLVEQSRLPVRRTLDKLGVLPARFYRWYDRYQSGGYEALKDRPPRLSSSAKVLTVPSTRSLRAPAPSGEAGVLAQAATAPRKTVAGVRPRRR